MRFIYNSLPFLTHLLNKSPLHDVSAVYQVAPLEYLIKMHWGSLRHAIKIILLRGFGFT
jgi:hypothetical protein